MKNMKQLLRVMAALGFSTVAASNVVACSSTSYKVPQINPKWAETLGWYDKNGNSLVTKVLEKKASANTWEIGLDLTTPATMSLKEALLTDTNKAKSKEAADFLKDLGFTSGSTTKDYSLEDTVRIANLVIKFGENNAKVVPTADKNDLTVTAGTFTIDIKKDMLPNAPTIKWYTVNSVESALKVKEKLTVPGELLENNSKLALTKDNGFVQGGKTADFVLKFTDTTNDQKSWDSLTKLLGGHVTTSWYSDADGKTPLDTFGNTIAYAKISINGAVVSDVMDCGIPKNN